MKQIVGFLLLLALLLGCAPQAQESSASTTQEARKAAAQESGAAEPTSQQIDAVRAEMAILAEGRWTEHSARWSPETGLFLLSATADADADATAIKAYCRLLDDVANKYLSGVKVSAAVFFQSGAKIQCK
jgi:hypothetical protein